jgi:hypothetical protein
MKSKVILVTLDVDLNNYYLVEDTINIWLKNNPKAKIHNVTQAGLGTKSIITTIFYID